MIEFLQAHLHAFHVAIPKHQHPDRSRRLDPFMIGIMPALPVPPDNVGGHIGRLPLPQEGPFIDIRLPRNMPGADNPQGDKLLVGIRNQPERRFAERDQQENRAGGNGETKPQCPLSRLDRLCLVKVGHDPGGSQLHSSTTCGLAALTCRVPFRVSNTRGACRTISS